MVKRNTLTSIDTFLSLHVFIFCSRFFLLSGLGNLFCTAVVDNKKRENLRCYRRFLVMLLNWGYLLRKIEQFTNRRIYDNCFVNCGNNNITNTSLWTPKHYKQNRLADILYQTKLTGTSCRVPMYCL